MNEEDKNKNLNPASQDIAEKTDFDRLLQAEKSTSKSDSSENDNLDNLKQKEETSGKQGFYRPSAKSTTKFNASALKKRGPIGLIIALVLGGGFGLSLLFSPGILLVQLKEVMVGKFNTQLASMDARTMRIIDAKTKEATKGACTGVKIKCRYASMSERQLKKFQAAGIDIKYEKTTVTGRFKPTSFSFNGGDPIPASEFRSNMINSPEFRNAVRKAYNPKFAGFADATWTKVKTKFGFNEGAPSKAKDVEERKKNLHEASKETAVGDIEKIPKDGEEHSHPLCASNPCSPDEIDKVNESIDKAKSIKSGTSQISDGVKGMKSVGSALSIAGYLEYACQAYGMIQLTSYAAKAIRTVQLATYAMQFLTVADMIKAGDATPDDVSQLGTILTSPATRTDGVTTGLSATDSFGYKYAAYGDTPTMSEYTSLFIVGGGLTGSLDTALKYVSDLLGGRNNARTTCGTLANPLVQVGSIIAGIAFCFTGIGVGKVIAQAGIGIAVTTAIAILPSLLDDIIAGRVTENIQGEDSGDAITSGSGAFMGTTANYGGNALLSKEQAVAYNKLQQEVAANYLKDEAAQLSPFDASNKYTFLGSIASSLIPTRTSMAFTVSGSLGSLFSLYSNIASNIVPKTSAITAAQQESALSMCQDYDYLEIGAATDPFCNPIFGIPTQYLDADPLEVVDELAANGYYRTNADGTDYEKTEKYEEFISNCGERRANPYGYSEVNSNASDGAECIIDSKIKAYLYLNIIDERVETGMDGYELPADAASTPTSGAVPTSLGSFIFPLKVTQSVMKNNWSCWNETDQTCHGTESSGYYASDLFGETGTEIVAATDGIVGPIGYTSSTGHMINIKGNDCTDGTQTCKGQGTLAWYGHILQGSVVVKEGQEVTAGTTLGKIGTSAEANNTTPHLHIDFSDRKNQVRPPCSRQTISLCKAAGFLNVQKYLHDAFMKLPQ